MTNWNKLQPRYEKKAYRIVQKHIKLILSRIPVDNTNLNNYEIIIELNIHSEDVFKMFLELYNTIGIDYANRVNKDLEKVTKLNPLFNTQLLKEILLFLSGEGGIKITSVKNALIEAVIKSVKDSIGKNATVIEIQNAIQAIITKSQTFYKWQSLRIARTETTSASNFAALKTAQESNLVLSKQWIAVMDKRTRPDHYAENEEIVDLNEPFILASGAVLQYPGDISAHANEVINCRCTMSFIPKRDANGMLILKTNM